MWHHVYCFSKGLLKVEENKTHHQSSCRWKRWETHTRCHQKAGERERKEGDSYCFSISQRAERIDLKGAERWNQSFRWTEWEIYTFSCIFPKFPKLDSLFWGCLWWSNVKDRLTTADAKRQKVPACSAIPFQCLKAPKQRRLRAVVMLQIWCSWGTELAHFGGCLSKFNPISKNVAF